MTKALTNPFADEARKAFDNVVDGLIIQKIPGVPSFAQGVSLANDAMLNNFPSGPGKPREL